MSHAANDKIYYQQPIDSSKGEYDLYYDEQAELPASEDLKDFPPQDVNQTTRTSIGKEEKKATRSIWTSPSNSFPFFYQQNKTPDKSPYKDFYEGSEKTLNKNQDSLEAMAERWNKGFHIGDIDP